MKLSELNTYSKAQIRQLSTTILERAIQKAKDLYYAGRKLSLTDAKYDQLEDELRSRDPKHPLLKKVGSSKVGRKKVKLPYPLFSLSKIKPDMPKEFARWTAKYPGPYVISNKEDGSSLELVYAGKGKKGWELSSVYTRGDGTIGQDVSHLIPYLDVPKLAPKEGMTIRAEISMTDAVFKKSFASEGFANSRNLVAGMMNRIRGDHSALKKAHVLAYEVISPRMTPQRAFQVLDMMGFMTAPWRVTDTIDIPKLQRLFKEARAKSPRPIDGLVIENNSINKRPPAGTHSPSYAFAFKDQGEDDSATVKIERIDWEETKHGKLQPVIVIPPTPLAGVTVTNISGHNAFFIVHGYRSKEVGKARRNNVKLVEKPLGKGAIIKIVRSGDVIPHVVEVVKAAKAPGLPKGIDYTWDSGKVYIMMDTKTDLVRDKRITDFFVKLDVEGVKLGVVQKLTEAGYTSIIKILRADAEDFLEIPGFKRRSAEKLAASIRAKCKEAPLHLLMAGSGHFGAGFGSKRFEAIINAYPNLLTTWEKLSPNQIKAKVVGIEGFQEKTAAIFAAGFHKFTKWLRLSKIKPLMPAKVKVVGKKMTGQAVCFTGVRDKELEKAIVANGGSIASGVNAKTTILIAVPGKSSSKLSKAESLGIPVYDLVSFKKKYKL